MFGSPFLADPPPKEVKMNCVSLKPVSHSQSWWNNVLLYQRQSQLIIAFYLKYFWWEKAEVWWQMFLNWFHFGIKTLIAPVWNFQHWIDQSHRSSFLHASCRICIQLPDKDLVGNSQPVLPAEQPPLPIRQLQQEALMSITKQITFHHYSQNQSSR